MSAQYYDSAQRRIPVVSELQTLWRERHLLMLLVRRDITVRYKRSSFGAWWTFLNPLLTTAVLWVVFSQIFRFPNGDAPYIVYLLTGVTVTTFFSQASIATGTSMINNAAVLRKVYVAPELFGASASLAGAVNFVIHLAMIAVATSVVMKPPSFAIVWLPLPVILLTLFVIGVGLVIAAGAAFYYDVLSFAGFATQLAVYATPAFYPAEIVPEQYEWLLDLNPLRHHLDWVRYCMYGSEPPSVLALVIVSAASIAVFSFGILMFARAWSRVVITL